MHPQVILFKLDSGIQVFCTFNEESNDIEVCYLYADGCNLTLPLRI